MRYFQTAVAASLAVLLATPALAQSGRATGVVRDASGQTLRGAIVRAHNTLVGSRGDITSTTDDKGRWSMIGLSSSTWEFSVEAEGYVTTRAEVPVRLAGTSPMTFTLVRDPGPLPGALDKNIVSMLENARAMREQGRLDQAIATYLDIRSKNGKLTAVNLVLADTYRQKAALETDTAARRALLERAIASYTELLAGDAGNRHAAAALAETRSDAGRLTP